MEKNYIQPIQDEPALFIEDKKILIIADLHIGIEEELKEYGLHAGSQTQIIIKKIEKICKEYKPKEIYLLGDIKHNIPSSTFQERKDVKNFIKYIKKFGKIHIIPGNHDGNIKKIVPEDIIVHPSNGIVLENLGLIHGHRWPKKELLFCDEIIIGHTHPTIMLTDRMKYKNYEPCWVKTKLILDKIKVKYSIDNSPELLIIPAFNPLCGGIAINKEGLVGPLNKITDIENSVIYLLDGTLLGKVKDI